MSGILDDQTMDLPCPKCGYKTRKTISWIKTHENLTCSCGAVIQLKTDEFRRKIGEIESFFDKLRR